MLCGKLQLERKWHKERIKRRGRSKKWMAIREHAQGEKHQSVKI